MPCNLQRGFRWTPTASEDLDSAAVACPSWPLTSRPCGYVRPLNFEPAASQGCDLQSWRPAALSRQAFARALTGRTLRFIGDSLSSDHYKYLTRCVLNCSYEEMRPGTIVLKHTQRQWASALAAAGHEPDAIEWALKHLRAQDAKEGYASGCAVGRGGRVDFRRINQLPGAERWWKHNTTHDKVTAAVMHALLYLPSRLTSRDVALVNFGLHQTNKLPAMVGAMLRWWQKAAASGSGGAPPRLLWRQASPQHWPNAQAGQFRSYADVLATATESCRAAPTKLSDDRGLAAAALARYDLNVSAAIAASELASARPPAAGVLDVFTATWERVDDHPSLFNGALALSSRQMDDLRGRANGSLADCTHYCLPGSTLRFWTQALLWWLVEYT